MWINKKWVALLADTMLGLVEGYRVYLKDIVNENSVFNKGLTLLNPAEVNMSYMHPPL